MLPVQDVFCGQMTYLSVPESGNGGDHQETAPSPSRRRMGGSYSKYTALRYATFKFLIAYKVSHCMQDNYSVHS
jgi:hypothetical protein